MVSASPKQQVSVVTGLTNYSESSHILPRGHLSLYTTQAAPYSPWLSPLMAPDCSLCGPVWHTASSPLSCEYKSLINCCWSHLSRVRWTLFGQWCNPRVGSLLPQWGGAEAIKTNRETNWMLPGQVSSLDRGWYKDNTEREVELGVTRRLGIPGFIHAPASAFPATFSQICPSL